jgi:hypothetical protein
MLGNRTGITVVAAYGRDYKSKESALADWNADKDFREAITSQYVNKAGAHKLGLTVTIRYNGNRSAIEAPTAPETNGKTAPVTKKTAPVSKKPAPATKKKPRRPEPPLLGLMGRTSA